MRPSSTRILRLVVFVLVSTLAMPAAAHSPHDVIDVVGLSQGGDGEQVIFARVQLTSKALFIRSFDSGRSWSVTALPINERSVSRIVMSPAFATDQTAFVSTTDQGILKTVDRGDSWTVLNSGGLNTIVLDLVVSPDYATSQKLVAATAAGTMISLDGGLTWTTHTTGLAQLDLSRLAVAATRPRTLLGGKSILHRSDNGGLSWTPLFTFDAGIVSLELSPDFATDGTAIVCLANGAGVHTTQDGGFSWQPMVLGLSEATVNDVALGRHGKAFAVTPVDGLFHGVVGGTWSPAGTGFEVLSDLTTNHYRTVDLSSDFAQDDNVWVGGFEGLFRSEDAAATFRPMDIYHQRYVRTVVLAPDFGSSGRMFLQPYGGGLLTTPPTPAGLMGGGTVGTITGNAPGSGPGSGLGSGTQPGASAVSTGSPLSQPASPPIRWESRSGPITALFGQCLELSPDWPADQTLYYAQSGLWRSDDGAHSWTTLTKPPGTDVLRALRLSPDFADDRLMLLGGGLGGGVFRSEDAGDSWTGLSAGLPAVPSPAEFAYSPQFAFDQTVFLIDRKAGFYVSHDRGDSRVRDRLGRRAPPLPVG